MCDDGWWLRDEIVWHKPNPMPSSVKDRTTPAHEMIYMFSKAPRYFYDQQAISEPLASGSIARLSQDVDNQDGSKRANGGVRADRPMKAVYKKPYTGKATKDFASSGAQDASAVKTRIVDKILSGEIVTRNKRSVWTVAPKPFREAHFATFPPDLITPCILAGCPVGGVVLDPFGGAGTTALVAQRNGRSSILIELNPSYVAIAERRLFTDDMADLW
jgi:DNA modification methylase